MKILTRIAQVLVLLAVASSFAQADDFIYVKKKAAAAPGGGAWYYSNTGGDSWDGTEAEGTDRFYGGFIPVTSGTTCTKIEVKISADNGTPDLKVALYDNAGTTVNRLDSGCTVTHPVGTGWKGCDSISYSISTPATVAVAYELSAAGGITIGTNTAGGAYLYSVSNVYSSFPQATVGYSSGTGPYAVRIWCQ